MRREKSNMRRESKMRRVAVWKDMGRRNEERKYNYEECYYEQRQ